MLRTFRTIQILIPVYNDWGALVLLLNRLDDVVAGQHGLAVRILVVDDGSSQPQPPELAQTRFTALQQVELLALRRNLNHQRAIAVGLAWVAEHRECDAVLVMDGDGEDRADDVPRLLEQLEANKGQRIVFAARTRRSESRTFQFFYRVYQAVHWLLTGIEVRVGNFSVIPRRLLDRVVVLSELWNHYAAAVFKSRIPYESIPTRRGERLMGRSQMNFVSLAAHGLGALSVHGELVGVRLLIAAAVLAAAGLGCGLLLILIRLFTSLAIPGWTSTVGGIVVLFLLQLGMLATTFILLVLHGRSGFGFIPCRDYAVFVHAVHRLPCCNPGPIGPPPRLGLEPDEGRRDEAPRTDERLPLSEGPPP